MACWDAKADARVLEAEASSKDTYVAVLPNASTAAATHNAFAADHVHTQPQAPLYSRTHPFHPPSFSKIWRWLHARLRKLAT